MIKPNDNLQIAPNYVLHCYGESSFLYDIKMNFNFVELNLVETDIIMCINEFHTISLVWEKIRSIYRIADRMREAQSLFYDYVSDLWERNILTFGKSKMHVYGEHKKCYPFVMSVELTNRCNFQCTHCYKEAGICNDTFLPTQIMLDALKDLGDKIYRIEYTGGEATLHPDFEKIIAATDVSNKVLLTNGSRLTCLSQETLKKLDLIQVSMYGCSSYEYEKYAKTTSFQSVCRGLERLNTLNVNSVVAIILRTTNIETIEQYVCLLREIGVKRIRFGLSKIIGRNSDPTCEWNLSYDDCYRFQQIYDELKQKHPDIIFDDFDWQDEFGLPLSHKKTYDIKCSAGKRRIVLSEHGFVRPCVFMPPQFFGVATWKQYKQIIESGNELNYDNAIHMCQDDFEKRGKTLDSICSKAFG